MTKEEEIKSSLETRFAFLANTVRIARPRRILVEVDGDKFGQLFKFATGELGFTTLCTITGLDEGERIGFIYHIARQDGQILNIKTYTPKAAPVVHSITQSFPCADVYERELVDLLGVTVEGLPEGKRYPLPDDWPAGEFPLRKDWKPRKKEDQGGDQCIKS